jgi:hypothetical protein
MRPSVRAALLLGLLAVASGSAVLAYSALTSRAHHAPHWDRAVAYARAADRTEAIVPALALRGRALTELGALTRSGPDAERSRAALLAGLLELENAAQARSDSQAHMELAAAAFQQAVRLDPTNDDAAYDLELLLARSKAAGKPVGDVRRKKEKGGAGRAGAQRTGRGY